MGAILISLKAIVNADGDERKTISIVAEEIPNVFVDAGRRRPLMFVQAHLVGRKHTIIVPRLLS